MPTNENSRLPGRTSPEPACFRRRVSQGRGPKEAWRRKGRTSELLSLTRRVLFLWMLEGLHHCQKLLRFPKALQNGVPHSVPFCLFTGWTPQNGAFRHSSWLSFAAKRRAPQKSDTPNCLLRQCPPCSWEDVAKGGSSNISKRNYKPVGNRTPLQLPFVSFDAPFKPLHVDYTHKDMSST